MDTIRALFDYITGWSEPTASPRLSREAWLEREAEAHRAEEDARAASLRDAQRIVSELSENPFELIPALELPDEAVLEREGWCFTWFSAQNRSRSAVDRVGEGADDGGKELRRVGGARKEAGGLGWCSFWPCWAWLCLSLALRLVQTAWRSRGKLAHDVKVYVLLFTGMVCSMPSRASGALNEVRSSHFEAQSGAKPQATRPFGRGGGRISRDFMWFSGLEAGSSSAGSRHGRLWRRLMPELRGRCDRCHRGCRWWPMPRGRAGALHLWPLAALGGSAGRHGRCALRGRGGQLRRLCRRRFQRLLGPVRWRERLRNAVRLLSQRAPGQESHHFAHGLDWARLRSGAVYISARLYDVYDLLVARPTNAVKVGSEGHAL